MVNIIIEGVFFVALVVTAGALFYWAVLYFTPIGRRIRESENRRRIDRAAELTCPLHGPHAEGQLVRLTTGERMCPACYQETMYGKLDDQ
jgi:hypothetical protein